MTLQSPSLPNSSNVLAVTGTSRYGTNLDGTYQITGGAPTSSCYGDFGTVQGTLIPSLSVSWSGTLVESAYDANGNPILDPFMKPITNIAGVTATIIQAAAPVTLFSVGGTTVSAFPLSGTVAFTKSPCYQSAAIDSTQSFISGASYQLTLKTDTGGTVTSSGSLIPSRETPITLAYTVSSGPCAFYQVNGNINNP